MITEIVIQTMVAEISSSAPLEHRLTYVMGKDQKDSFKPDREGL